MYPVHGGPGLPRNWTDGLDRGGLRGIPLLIGRTEHEMTAFSPGIGAPEDADDATRIEFDAGVVRMAETQAAQGQPVYVYRFARRSSSTPVLGATHCAELPFLFDNLDAYAEAPMTGPSDDADRMLAAEFSTAIAAFVASGFSDGGGWASYRPSDGGYVRRYG
jgi:para-nitrobenzyl esterase